MANGLNYLIGFCLGILPSLIWLVFWLKEDPHPESTRALIRAFIGGILAVPGAIIFQFISVMLLSGDNAAQFDIENLAGATLILMVLAWAGIEEILKLLTITKGSLFSSEDDERIDPVIYLITSAVGFAALENILFILKPIVDGDIWLAATVTDMRFVGATLLHILSSGVIGLAIGYSFYRKTSEKIMLIIGGIVLAIVLHAGFNLLIIGDVLPTMQTFGILWILIIILIYSMEKLKKLPNNLFSNTH